MCSVSMIADDWRQNHLPKIWSDIDPFANPPRVAPHVTREEFLALKAEVEALKRQLEEGKKQDEEEGNPDCEMEEKIDVLKLIGKIFDVDLEEVFSGSKTRSNK